MVVAALVVGLLVAFYFGVDAGAIAAVATAGLILASKIPGLWLIAYGVLTAGVVVVCLIGPRMKKQKGALSGLGWIVKRIRRRMK